MASIKTLNEKHNVISLRAFNEIYIGIMVIFCLAVLCSSFLNGFWSDIGLPLSFLVLFTVPVVFLITIIYFIVCIIIRLKIKKWTQNKWAILLPILAIFFILFMPFIYDAGKYTAYFYAGFDNLRRDADKLMATTPIKEANPNLLLPMAATELSPSEYPPSFIRVGAGRVFVTRSSVTIIRGGWVSQKYGIIIYAKSNQNAIDSGYGHRNPLSNRIFEFEWN